MVGLGALLAGRQKTVGRLRAARLLPLGAAFLQPAENDVPLCGSHALRTRKGINVNPSKDALRPEPQERFSLHSHAERGNDEMAAALPPDKGWQITQWLRQTSQFFGKREFSRVALEPGWTKTACRES